MLFIFHYTWNFTLLVIIELPIDIFYPLRETFRMTKFAWEIQNNFQQLIRCFENT